MRRYAFIDPDGDGGGSAGRLGELDRRPRRPSGAPLETPPLAPRLAPGASTCSGPAYEHGGYFFLVSPTRAGWNVGHHAARPSGRRSSRAALLGLRFWPTTADAPHSAAFFMDEHERILESSEQISGVPRLVGPMSGPSCDDALRHPDFWRLRRGKQPRTTLPASGKSL